MTLAVLYLGYFFLTEDNLIQSTLERAGANQSMIGLEILAQPLAGSQRQKLKVSRSPRSAQAQIM